MSMNGPKQRGDDGRNRAIAFDQHVVTAIRLQLLHVKTAGSRRAASRPSRRAALTIASAA